MNPVVRALQAGGLDVLAIHNHLIGESPQVVCVHFGGHGPAEQVAKALREAITEGEDLTHAKSQGDAMAKAKVSLSTAVSKAVAANAGFHAVSVFPSLKEVTLHKGAEWRTATEKLD